MKTTVLGLAVMLILWPLLALAGLLAPASLTASVVETEIRLSWVDVNTSETGTQVERSLQATSGFVVIATVPRNVTTYQAGGLAASTTYYYRVRATGRKGALSPYSATASATTPPAVILPPSPPGATLAVVLADTVTKVTLSQAQAAAVTAAAWLKENTWGRIALTPGAYRAALAPCSDVPAMLASARAAVGATPYRLVVVTTGCPFPGAGWPSAGVVVVNTDSRLLDIIPHEMGHTFALNHNAVRLDPADTMGGAFYSHFNVPHKGKIDWLLSAGWVSGPYPTTCVWDQGCDWEPAWSRTLTGDGSAALAPIELPSTAAPIAVRVPALFDVGGRAIEYVYLEYRQALGFDAWLGSAYRGVQVRLGPPYNGFQKLYPPSSDDSPGATQYVTTLLQGQTWQDCARRVKVTATSVGGSTAAVSVSRAAC